MIPDHYLVAMLMENDEAKILSNFQIRTEKHVMTNQLVKEL